MPVYRAHGTTASVLVELLERVLAAAERPTLVTEAGDSWVVVSERKPGPKPRAQTR